MAGTLVLTAEGFKPIEAIAAGDWVLAKDPQTGELKAKRVTFAYSSIHEDVLILTVRQGDGDEELIVTTSEHPFHVRDRGWVPAGDLTVEDAPIALSGEALAIVSIEFVAGARTAYNFEVADFHTYGVGDSQVWVHNSCSFPDKIRRQMGSRGWSKDSVRDTVNNPHTMRASRNKANGNPATAYYRADGSYVVVDDITGEVVQVSDRTKPRWFPDSEIQDPYKPNGNQ